MEKKEEEEKSPENQAKNEDEKKSARRIATTLGLCFRCGAVLMLGAAHEHDCSALRPN